jgi:hypothetical protein
MAAIGCRVTGVKVMRKLIGKFTLLSSVALMAACTKEAPKEETKAVVEAPTAEAQAATATEMLASLKVDAVVGLNVPISIKLDPNGKPIFMGSNQSGIVCKNPDCQPPSLQDKSFSMDADGNVSVNNWPGAVQFVFTIDAPGYLFPTDPSQAAAIVAGSGKPKKGEWDKEFTSPVGSPDRMTLSFSDKNGKNGTWEYSITVQNTATGQLVTVDPTISNGGIETREPEIPVKQ